MRRLIKWGVLLAMVLMVGGCQTAVPEQTGHEILLVPDKMISAQQLAQRLGLTVEQTTGALITLRNAANRVTVVPDGGGQASVNGKPVGPHGGFVEVSGIIFVPETLVGDVQSALQAPPAPASTAAAPSPHARRIVIDPGHGGDDPGTISRGGLREKTITLATAKELAWILKQDGYDVALTRQSDVFMDLDDRAAIANRFGADLFVSIHADTYVVPAVSGFTVYTCREASTECRAAADAVAEALQKAGDEGLGVRRANYRVLLLTQCPAILVELGYLSNSHDAAALSDQAVQASLARSIADGINEYFKR